ncbi:MAG: DUF2997 domain-containing protein [Spirochaetales bacterium]|jgi:hypothetical protein|nr:DUF2997 domain-containing protein [Spirochaetales bacterium]
MTQKTELTIHIARDGSVRIELDGARGPSCLDVTRELEESLGIVTERIKKAAFFEAEAEESVTLAGRGCGL